MERRNFLKTFFGVAAGMALPGVASAQVQSLIGHEKVAEHPGLTEGQRFAQAQPFTGDHLTMATYLPLEGSEFQVRNGVLTVPLQLVKVIDQKGSYASPLVSQEHFALRFQGSPASPLEQNTYTLSHPGLGKFDLFLVPVGKSENAIYEAIIQRH